MILSNMHTHTNLCDGKDAPEEIVQKAIELGMSSLGFSGHAYCPYDDCGMSDETLAIYKAEITRLGEKYRDSIKIYLGIEQDYYSDINRESLDYVIGSVHHVLKDGAPICVDYTRQELVECVERYYEGDYYSLAEDYYGLVGSIYEKTRCDIVGHFDLMTKFNEGDELFDTNHPRYRRAVEGALDTLLKTPAIFEINTGAIRKGYRSTPYPQKWIVDRIKRAGRRLILSSDCHDKNYLLFEFEKWEEWVN